MRVVPCSRICWIIIRRSPLDRPLLFIPLRFFKLLLLLEPETVTLPSEPAATPSSRESNWLLSLMLIVLPVPVLLLVLRFLSTILSDDVTVVLERVWELSFVLVVPLLVDRVEDLTLVLVVLLVVATVAGGGSSNAGALLSG